MKIILFFIFMGYAQTGFFQIILERQVISPFSLNLCDVNCLYSTAGQVDFITVVGSEHTLMAGFEQANGPLSLSITLSVIFNLCDDTYEVNVTDVTGCDSEDAISFFWNQLEGTSSFTSNSELTSLSVVSSGGCQYHSDLNLSQMEYEVETCDLEFFSFFSPNDDGDNDFWVIRNIENMNSTGNEVSILNRWGAVVWQAVNYNNNSIVWNGKTDSGETLPDGTYFYIVKQEDKEYKGFVELMR